MTQTSIRRFCLVCWQLWPTMLCWLGAIAALIVIERISASPWRWDRLILTAAHCLRHLGLDGFFSSITWTGSLYLLVPATVLTAGFLVSAGRSGDAWFLVLGLAGASLIAHISKPLFGRDRPDLYQPLVELPADASYPSAHTAQAFAFALALYVVMRPAISSHLALLIGLLFWAAAVGFSRVYLQVHFPSDVLGGTLLAVLWVGGLKYCLNSFGITAG